MKAFYSHRISNSLDADAEMSFEGKWVQLRFHETSSGMTFLLKRNELLALRDFVDGAIRYSEPSTEVQQGDSAPRSE